LLEDGCDDAAEIETTIFGCNDPHRNFWGKYPEETVGA
jgi:hypothetical protein